MKWATGGLRARGKPLLASLKELLRPAIVELVAIPSRRNSIGDALLVAQSLSQDGSLLISVE